MQENPVGFSELEMFIKQQKSKVFCIFPENVLSCDWKNLPAKLKG